MEIERLPHKMATHSIWIYVLFFLVKKKSLSRRGCNSHLDNSTHTHTQTQADTHFHTRASTDFRSDFGMNLIFFPSRRSFESVDENFFRSFRCHTNELQFIIYQSFFLLTSTSSAFDFAIAIKSEVLLFSIKFMLTIFQWINNFSLQRIEPNFYMVTKTIIRSKKPTKFTRVLIRMTQPCLWNNDGKSASHHVKLVAIGTHSVALK